MGRLIPEEIDETFDFDLGEEKLRVHAQGVPVERCNQCGLELSGPAAAKVRHNAICRTAGLFTPEEIKELRQRLEMSQDEFAHLAGVGVATISRWERGRVLQNRSNNNLLVLIAEIPQARQLLETRLRGRTQERADKPPGVKLDHPSASAS
jgi:putative zinc finger/helix-turn-helix YgiT family protein